MAESNEQSNWWGSWINSAKTKSASMLEAVKKDLEELTTTVKSEASTLAESLKIDENNTTASVVKKSISSFFETVTDALNPAAYDDDDTEAILITNDGSLTLTGFKKHLFELQSNDDTYVAEPSAELEGKYKRWLEITEPEQFNENRLAKYLAASDVLNDKYKALVPEKVEFIEFWKRYLFKKALLEDALANAEKAERKFTLDTNLTNVENETTVIKNISESSSDGHDDIIENDEKWTEDDFIAANIELTEEEQAKLLAEYEQEIQQRDSEKKSRKKSDNPKLEKSIKPVEPVESSSTAIATAGAEVDKTKLNIKNNYFKCDEKDENGSSNSDESSWEKV